MPVQAFLNQTVYLSRHVPKIQNRARRALKNGMGSGFNMFDIAIVLLLMAGGTFTLAATILFFYGGMDD